MNHTEEGLQAVCLITKAACFFVCKVSYVGFLSGTLYQYVLLRIMVDVIFADWETMPEFHFDWKAMLVSLVTFLLAYELILYVYSGKIERQSVKSIMLE